MVALGANEFSQAMEQAAGNGQLTAIKYLLCKGVTDLFGALVDGATGDQLSVVNFLLHNYALDINQAFRAALWQGR